MGTTLKGVNTAKGKIELHQFSGGAEKGRCLEVFVPRKEGDSPFNRPRIELTVKESLELAQALIEFSLYQRDREAEDASQQMAKVRVKTHYHPHLWQLAHSRPVGSLIECPACYKEHKKRSYQHKFCSAQCKDNYWNDKPERRERASELGYCHSEEELEQMEEDSLHVDLSWDAHKGSF